MIKYKKLKLENLTMYTETQKEIMHLFYNCAKTRVILNKKERTELWEKAAKCTLSPDEAKVCENKCPALANQIRRSYENNNNIQSAVFSECSYAQTLASMLGLSCFSICDSGASIFSNKEQLLLSARKLVPRYCYYDSGKTRILVQAGGCGGVDCALILVPEERMFLIEFKEPGAKTSEPDLPKYKEDGKLLITENFLARYPQFDEMLNEQKDLNFFNNMGNNVHNFTPQSIEKAVSNNYKGEKNADVICTEDKCSNLVMLPADQISKWATIEGEIRPAGRNHYKVWTPNALMEFLKKKGATINNNKVVIAKAKLEPRKERGGNGKISGYKINPLFFVYSADCRDINGFLEFSLNSVQQLNPTIAGKMFFKNLEYEQVIKHYAIQSENNVNK